MLPACLYSQNRSAENRQKARYPIQHLEGQPPCRPWSEQSPTLQNSQLRGSGSARGDVQPLLDDGGKLDDHGREHHADHRHQLDQDVEQGGQHKTACQSARQQAHHARNPQSRPPCSIRFDSIAKFSRCRSR